MKIRLFFGILFLSIQIVLIVYARFVPERFFCWAPYDEQISYKVIARDGDRFLTKQELIDRYRRRVDGWEQRSIHNLFNIIEQYEKTYGIKDSLYIEVEYSRNGKNKEKWIYGND